jgi:hypothetical protein
MCETRCSISDFAVGKLAVSIGLWDVDIRIGESSAARRRGQIGAGTGSGKMEVRAQEKLRCMGVCPVGYWWIKQARGYRCAGGVILWAMRSWDVINLIDCVGYTL